MKVAANKNIAFGSVWHWCWKPDFLHVVILLHELLNRASHHIAKLLELFLLHFRNRRTVFNLLKLQILTSKMETSSLQNFNVVFDFLFALVTLLFSLEYLLLGFYLRLSLLFRAEKKPESCLPSW